MDVPDSLLAGVRVLDLSSGATDAVTRLLADLGADVLKVEHPGGSPGRDTPPMLAAASIPFALHNANKRSTVLDPLQEADWARLRDLAADADIVVTDDLGGPDGLAGPSGRRAPNWPPNPRTWWC